MRAATVPSAGYYCPCGPNGGYIKGPMTVADGVTVFCLNCGESYTFSVESLQDKGGAE